jgi:hypothetical protein
MPIPILLQPIAAARFPLKNRQQKKTSCPNAFGQLVLMDK